MIVLLKSNPLNKQLLIFILIIFSLTSFGQIAYIDDLNNLIKDSSGEARLNHIFMNEFSRIANTNTHGAIGNYVGFSSKDNTISFAYNFVRKNGLLELNASAGILEGVTTLVTNSEINTGVSIGIKSHWIFGDTNIAINYNEIDTIIKEDQKLTDTYILENLKHSKVLESLENDLAKKQKVYDSIKANLKLMLKGEGEPALDLEKAEIYTKRKLILESEKDLLEHQIKHVEEIMATQIETLKEKRDAVDNTDLYKQQEFYIDSLEVKELPHELAEKLKAKKKEISALEKLIKSNIYDQTVYDKLLLEEKIAKHELKVAKEKKAYFINNGDFVIMDRYNTYVDARKKNLEKIDNIRATDIKLSWLTLGGSLSNESFSLYDPSLSYNNQIYKENDIVPSASLSLTYYINKADESSPNEGARQIYYFTIGGTIKYGNNLGSLTQVDIQTKDSTSTNRSVIKTQKAYMGDYLDNQVTAQVYSDYYQFIGTKDNIGFHLRGTIDIGPQVPVTSVRVGLLFAATKKDDFKSVANFEIFYGLNNIFKTGEEDSLLGRNIFGIQTSFPFNLIVK